ncbi:hypothetical protein BaRGS_00003261, partial [Batillaria attramentaria]
ETKKVIRRHVVMVRKSPEAVDPNRKQHFFHQSAFPSRRHSRHVRAQEKGS